MVIFKSLNCCHCYLPCEISKKDCDRKPRVLECGLAMCYECLNKDLVWKPEERRHQCSETWCLSNRRDYTADFLEDLISQDFITLIEMKSGYVLSKPDPRIECPICHEEYSLTKAGKAPFDLTCNHTICDGCLSKNKKPWTDGYYTVFCPICHNATNTKLTTRDNPLKEFLRELPRMIEQYKEGETTVKCSGCKTLNDFETMFHCSSCAETICVECALRHHERHQFNDLISISSNRISDAFKEMATSQISSYEVECADFRNENKKIMLDLRMKLLAKADEMKTVKNILEVRKKQQELRYFDDRLQAISKEYMPLIDRFNSRLKDLLGQLEK